MQTNPGNDYYIYYRTLNHTFLVWSGINIGVLNNHVISTSLFVILLHHHELAPVLDRQVQQAFNNLKHKCVCIVCILFMTGSSI